MSVWSNAKICVIMRKDSGCSVKTLINDTFCEPIIGKYTQDNVDRTHISIVCDLAYCEDGIQAAKSMESFVKRIKEYDSKSYVDVTVEIRF